MGAGRAGGNEAFAVEATEKVLLTGATLRGSGVKTDLERPYGGALAVSGRNLDEIRTLPVAVDVAGRAEVAEQGPLL